MAVFLQSNSKFYIKENFTPSLWVGGTFQISGDLEDNSEIESGWINTFVVIKNESQLERFSVTLAGGIATIVKRGLKKDWVTEDTNLRKIWGEGSIGYITPAPLDFIATAKLDTAGGLRTTMGTAQNIWATNGSPNITVADTTGWANGATITGTGIPGGTTIVSFVPNTSAVLSANFTGTTGTVSVIVWKRMVLEIDSSNNEIKKVIWNGTTIAITDTFRKTKLDWTYEDIPYENIRNDLISANFPLQSLRETFTPNSFGVWYTLVWSSTLSWSDSYVGKTSMGTARAGLHTGVIETKLYVAWGNNGTSWAFATSEEYDFVTNTWSSKASMPAGRTNGYSGVISWKFYVIGWLSDWASLTSYQVSCYEYDPVANTWASRATLASAQWEGASAVWNGRLYIIGWRNTTPTVLNTVQYYDPVSNTYTTGLAAIPSARWNTQHQGITVGNTIYLVSGKDSGGTNQTTMYAYNPVANTWGTLAVVPAALHWSAVAGMVLDGAGKIFVISWNTTGIVTTNYEYNIVTNTWATRTAVGTGTILHSAEAYNGKVYYLGWYTWAASAQNIEYSPLRTRYLYERTS